MYVRNYLKWIHDIQDKNALYSIDPIQTREWVRRLTKGPLNPLLTDIQKLDHSLATHMTKPSYDARTLLGASAPS